MLMDHLLSDAFLDDNIPVLTHPIIYSDGKYLSLVDAASRTPLYHVEVCRQALQMEMIRLSPAPSDDTIKRFPRMRTSTFSAGSTQQSSR